MAGTPVISIILPVLNEAGTINESIAHLRGIDRGNFSEIIVVDGDPEGSTIRAIQAGGYARRSRKGRSRQMNHGAALATGDILLFLHADTELPRNAFALIADALKDGRVAAGAFDLGMKSHKRIYRITETYVYLRTRLTRVPFGDQAIFMRRAYFERISGYLDIPVMEDVEIMKRIRKRGYHHYHPGTGDDFRAPVRARGDSLVHAQELGAPELVRPRRVTGAFGEILPVIVNMERFAAFATGWHASQNLSSLSCAVRRLDNSNGRDILLL
jgi:rSAM/selenodomain-associated transferase 2